MSSNNRQQPLLPRTRAEKEEAKSKGLISGFCVAAKEAFEKKRADLLPLIDDDLVKGSEYIETLEKPRLKEILLYRYSVKSGEVGKMRVSQMKAFILGKMTSDDE
jgi:hypothetical protein